MSPARSANAPLAVRCATMRSAIDLVFRVKSFGFGVWGLGFGV